MYFDESDHLDELQKRANDMAGKITTLHHLIFLMERMQSDIDALITITKEVHAMLRSERNFHG